MKNQLLATGRVDSLSIDGRAVSRVDFRLAGPVGDAHSGTYRPLSGHDGAYINTSQLVKGDRVFNWRSWTGLSSEEIADVERALGVKIPQGCLLENITVSGISHFSQLAPTTRLVFPKKGRDDQSQAILAVWEGNSPCKGVGERLEQHHGKKGLCTNFIAAAQEKRGVMGFVLAAGYVEVGDPVLIYPPTE